MHDVGRAAIAAHSSSIYRETNRVASLDDIWAQMKEKGAEYASNGVMPTYADAERPFVAHWGSRAYRLRRIDGDIGSSLFP